MQEAKHGLFLIGGLLLGVLLQLLGCALWKNWWPLLNAIFYGTPTPAHLALPAGVNLCCCVPLLPVALYFGASRRVAGLSG